MRAVLRDADTHAYWDDRWSAYEADAEEFRNLNIYPVKYVDPIMTPGCRTLEAGCGLGRVVKHYHKRGFDIVGCDYSGVAVQKLNRSAPHLQVREADITDLPYADREFDNVLALGVFHGLENLDAIRKGLAECVRCLKPGGRFVVSVRADTYENILIDRITESRGKHGTRFHKWCFSEEEFRSFLREGGFRVLSAQLITNVCFLTKFKFFRAAKSLEEGAARSDGFQLNALGQFAYAVLKTCRPSSFGTTWVFTATPE